MINDDGMTLRRVVNATVVFDPPNNTGNHQTQLPVPQPLPTPNQPVRFASDEYSYSPNRIPSRFEHIGHGFWKGFQTYRNVSLAALLVLLLALAGGIVLLMHFDPQKIGYIDFWPTISVAQWGFIYIVGYIAASGLIIWLVRASNFWRIRDFVFTILNFLATWNLIDIFHIIKISPRGFIIWLFFVMFLDLWKLSKLGLLDTFTKDPLNYIFAVIATMLVTRQMELTIGRFRFFWYSFLLGIMALVVSQTILGLDPFHTHVVFDNGYRF